MPWDGLITEEGKNYETGKERSGRKKDSKGREEKSMWNVEKDITGGPYMD